MTIDVVLILIRHYSEWRKGITDFVWEFDEIIAHPIK